MNDNLGCTCMYVCVMEFICDFYFFQYCHILSLSVCPVGLYRHCTVPLSGIRADPTPLPTPHCLACSSVCTVVSMTYNEELRYIERELDDRKEDSEKMQRKGGGDKG